MMVYPDPATSLINMDFKLKENSNVSMNLYDLNGRILKSASYGNLQNTNHNTTMNINDLSSGLYILSIQAGQSVITKKI